MLVYDITDEESFHYIGKVLNDVKAVSAECLQAYLHRMFVCMYKTYVIRKVLHALDAEMTDLYVFNTGVEMAAEVSFRVHWFKWPAIVNFNIKSTGPSFFRIIQGVHLCGLWYYSLAQTVVPGNFGCDLEYWSWCCFSVACLDITCCFVFGIIKSKHVLSFLCKNSSQRVT